MGKENSLIIKKLEEEFASFIRGSLINYDDTYYEFKTANALPIVIDHYAGNNQSSIEPGMPVFLNSPPPLR